MIFYSDETTEVTYEELLRRLNERNGVHISYFEYTYSEFIENLLCAIVNGVDLTLFDSNFTSDEITRLGFSQDSSEVHVTNGVKLIGLDQLVECILSSSSKITLFTSGTSGLPKKIEHTISTLTRSVKIGSKFRDNVWGLTYNPSHMAGLQVLFQAVLNQNTMINLYKLSPWLVSQKINQFGITHLSGTPTFYRLFLAIAESNDTLEQLTFGGEKSSSELIGRVTELFPNARISNIYASTEAGSLLLSDGDIFRIPQSLDGLVKVENNELYVHQTLLGKGDFKSGDWFGTGDRVEYADKNQTRFRFIGRATDMLNIGGYKVNPHEIEALLRSFEGIIDCRVYAKANSVLGKILSADVVCRNDIYTEIDLKSRLRVSLSPYKVPRKIYFKEKLKLNRSGKITRNDVKG